MRLAQVWLGILASFGLIACSGSSAPTAPSAVIPSPTPTSFGAFGTVLPPITPAGSSIDFSACLQRTGVQCFQARGLRTEAVRAAAAVGVPINLSATAAGSAVTLTWIAPQAGEAIAAYVIEAGSTPGAADLANFSTGSTATSYFAPNVGAGTYFVRVRALGAGGIGAASNEAVLVVSGSGCVGVPGPPGGLAVALNSGGTVVLVWNGASGNPSSYILEAGSSPGLSNAARSDLGRVTTVTATGVGAGVYYVRIRAASACGVGPASNEVVVVVLSPASPADYGGTWTGVYQIAECHLLHPGETPDPCAPIQRQNGYQLNLAQSGSVVTGRYKLTTFLYSCPCGGNYGEFDMAGTVSSAGALSLSGIGVPRASGVTVAITFNLTSPTPGSLSGTVTGILSLSPDSPLAVFSGPVVSGSRQ